MIKPHAEISTQTVSRWLRNALTGAAIDVGFPGHSTRGAATSAAAEAGLSLDIIMAAADWASSATFEQFYHKPSTRGAFASYGTAHHVDSLVKIAAFMTKFGFPRRFPHKKISWYWHWLGGYACPEWQKMRVTCFA